MTDTPVMTSHRPYLLRALYEWIADNGLTPHLLVDATRPGTISRTDPARLPAEILPALPAIPHAPAAAPRGTGQPVEQQPASGGWFSLFDELEQRHLATFRAKHYSYRGDDLREEILTAITPQEQEQTQRVLEKLLREVEKK